MTARLRDLLNKPMKHISDVRRCFNFCQTEEDVEEVLGMIPRKHGDFEVDYPASGETFIVTNTFVENDELFEETAEYEFFVEEAARDDIYSDCTTDELKSMGSFNNLKEVY